MIDRLDGVEHAMERAVVIGDDNAAKMAVQPHSLHKFATIKHEVNLWLLVLGYKVQDAIFVLVHPFFQDNLLVGGLAYFLFELDNDWGWFEIVHFLFFCGDSDCAYFCWCFSDCAADRGWAHAQRCLSMLHYEQQLC